MHTAYACPLRVVRYVPLLSLYSGSGLPFVPLPAVCPPSCAFLCAVALSQYGPRGPVAGDCKTCEALGTVT